MEKPKFRIIIFVGLFMLGGIPGLIYLAFYLLKRFIYNLFFRKKGYIEFYKLERFWKGLTRKEKRELLCAFNSISNEKNALIDGDVETDIDKNLFLTQLSCALKPTPLKFDMATRILGEMRKTNSKTTDEYFALNNLIIIFKELKKFDFENAEDYFFEAISLQIKIGKFVRPFLGKALTISCRGYDELIVYFRAQNNAQRVKELQDEAIEDGWRIKEYKRGLGVR